MEYPHIDHTSIFILDTFKDSFTIAQPTQQQVDGIRYWVNTEPAPSARDLAAVMENCQGWAIRVMSRLVEEIIVEKH